MEGLDNIHSSGIWENVASSSGHNPVKEDLEGLFLNLFDLIELKELQHKKTYKGSDKNFKFKLEKRTVKLKKDHEKKESITVFRIKFKDKNEKRKNRKNKFEFDLMDYDTEQKVPTKKIKFLDGNLCDTEEVKKRFICYLSAYFFCDEQLSSDFDLARDKINKEYRIFIWLKENEVFEKTEKQLIKMIALYVFQNRAKCTADKREYGTISKFFEFDGFNYLNIEQLSVKIFCKQLNVDNAEAFFTKLKDSHKLKKLTFEDENWLDSPGFYDEQYVGNSTPSEIAQGTKQADEFGPTLPGQVHEQPTSSPVPETTAETDTCQGFDDFYNKHTPTPTEKAKEEVWKRNCNLMP